MSQLLINGYLKQLDLIKKMSGSSRETIVREAYKDLLKAWGKQNDLVFLAEYRFADYKEKVIDLLLRVSTVSVETERITRAMQNAER